MAEFCLTNPIPTFSSAYDLLIGNAGWPPTEGLTLPIQPTLPKPIFPGFNIPHAEIVLSALELQSSQLMTTCFNMASPLVGVIGGALDDMLPKVPGLDINLLDFLAMNPQSIVSTVKAALDIPIDIPFLNLPLVDIDIPELEAIMATSMIAKNYLMILPTFIAGLVDEVTDILEIGGMTFSVTMPTPEQVFNLLISLVPDVNNIDELIRKVQTGLDLAELFSSFAIPPFPSISFSSPMIPSINFPVMEFYMMLGAVMNSFTSFGLSIIMDFIVNTLSNYIGFSFPLVCLEI